MNDLETHNFHIASESIYKHIRDLFGMIGDPNFNQADMLKKQKVK